jgi:methylphosphotriester-DNA--protein-cysteine methyltransferase
MITPEQRDQVPLCGARKKNKELCRAFAGQGTNHPGTGRCKFHGGATPNHGKRAVTQEMKRRMVTMGEPVEDVTALSALLSELYASTGHVAWLRQQIADMSPEHLGTVEGQAIISLYNSERDRKTKIAKMCTEAGVDEAAVRVAEAQVQILGTALARACDTAGISAPLRQRIGAALRDELAQAQAKPEPLRLVAGSSS